MVQVPNGSFIPLSSCFKRNLNGANFILLLGFIESRISFLASFFFRSYFFLAFFDADAELLLCVALAEDTVVCELGLEAFAKTGENDNAKIPASTDRSITRMMPSPISQLA